MSAHLVLASASPRRKMLLEQAGYRLLVQPADIDETPRDGEDPRRYARRMAEEKAEAIQADAPVVAADTVVHQAGQIFGKPRDPSDAVDILMQLQGQRHHVSTGWCVRWRGELHSGVVTTGVQFRALRESQVRAYVATGEPMDKAGGYGIQGLGGALVVRIEGSYSNVVGLPLAKLFDQFEAMGLPGPFESPREER